MFKASKNLTIIAVSLSKNLMQQFLLSTKHENMFLVLVTLLLVFYLHAIFPLNFSPLGWNSASKSYSFLNLCVETQPLKSSALNAYHHLNHVLASPTCRMINCHCYIWSDSDIRAWQLANFNKHSAENLTHSSPSIELYTFGPCTIQARYERIYLSFQGPSTTKYLTETANEENLFLMYKVKL